MRVFLVFLAIAIFTGCAFTANTKEVGLKHTPESVSYDIDLKVVQSSGSVDIPFGDQVMGWIDSAIDEVTGFLNKAKPTSDSDDS